MAKEELYRANLGSDLVFYVLGDKQPNYVRDLFFAFYTKESDECVFESKVGSNESSKVESTALHIKYDSSGLDRWRPLFDAVKDKGVVSARTFEDEEDLHSAASFLDSGDYTASESRGLRDVDTDRPGRKYAKELSRKVRDGVVLYEAGQAPQKTGGHKHVWYHFSVFRSGRTATSVNIT
jgi:hypothetical protein